MSIPRLRTVFRAVLFSVLITVFSYAQTFRGSISGTVSDATGAVIPGAVTDIVASVALPPLDQPCNATRSAITSLRVRR